MLGPEHRRAQRLQSLAREGRDEICATARTSVRGGGRARDGRAAEALRGIQVHLPPPIKRKRKWVFILWISRAPARGAEEASRRARSEPPRPLTGLRRRRRGSERGRHVLFELQ